MADQNDLRKYVKTCHKVVGAKWNQEKQAWSVRIVETDHREIASSSKGVAEGETPNQQTADYDILINASGFFNDWKWPSVPGREDFKGKLLHSAAWPAVGDACVDGKVVALIGNGSSGVQILPAIINRVEKVYVYTRSATWVTTPLAEKFAGPGGSNIIFTEEQKVRWEEHPEEYLAYRKEVEKVMNERFRLYMAGSETQKKAYEFSSNQMKEKLINGGKSELADLLLPKFEVGYVALYPYLFVLRYKADFVTSCFPPADVGGQLQVTGTSKPFARRSAKLFGEMLRHSPLLGSSRAREKTVVWIPSFVPPASTYPVHPAFLLLD